MKLCLKILAIVVIAASTYSLIGCSAPAGFSYQNVTIALSAQCSDCPAGISFNPNYPVPATNGTQQTTAIPAGAVLTMDNQGEGGVIELLATVTNAPASSITWSIYPQPNLGSIDANPSGTSTPVGESGSSVGSFVTPGGSTTTASGPTAYYSQGGIPVYGGAALVQANALGIPQGDVMIVASVPSDPNNPSAVVTYNQLVQIYNGSTAQGPPTTYLTPKTPTTPAGLTNPVVTVPHNGGTYAFYGGTVGAGACLTTATCGTLPLYSTDNTSIWEVGPTPYSLTTAVIGGNASLGTISTTGVYTAPATIPTTAVTGTAGEVVVIVASHLVPTVATYAYVGIN